MRIVLLGCLLFVACADPVDPDGGPSDAGSTDIGQRPDAADSGPDSGVTSDVGFDVDATPNDDATPGMDAAPTDSGFVFATACGAPGSIETNGVNIFRPFLESRGDEVYFLYSEGLNPPYRIMASFGDGLTFGAPIEVLGSLADVLRPGELHVARDGRIAADGAHTNLTQRVRGILGSDHTSVGSPSMYDPGGLGCPAAFASSSSEIVAINGHPGGTFADGLDYTKASALEWSATSTLGLSGTRAYQCDVGLNADGDGAAIVATGSMPAVSIRAFRAGQPLGAVYTATIAGTSLSRVTMVAQGSGDAVAYAVVGTPLGSSLWEIALVWDEAGQRFSPTSPVEIVADDFTGSYGYAIDADDRVTFVYIADARTWAKRKLGGVWQPKQELGQPGGFGQDPVVRLDADGNVAVLYVGANLDVALRQAERDSPTFGPELSIPGANALNGSAMAWHPAGGLIAAWSVGTAGINDIVAARCQ